MKDVASSAGVSMATVSRVLTDSPRVHPATRARVLQVMKDIDYRPDQVARSLRRRRSNLIGLVVSTIENVFFTEIARAAEQAAHQRGYNLIICNTDESMERERVCVEILSQQLVAGIALVPAPDDGSSRQYLIDCNLPIILINRHADHLPFPSIIAADEQAAFECVSQLIQQGKRRIAVIIGMPDISTTPARLHGYRRALTAANLPIDPTLEICGYANLEGGYRAAHALLQRSPRPDAIFVHNNMLVQGTILALQDLGLRWPEQVDVAGFGTFSTSRLYQPPLRLIAQPTHEMGRRAVEMLVGYVEGGRANPMESIVLANRVIPPESMVHEWQRNRTTAVLEP